MRIGATYRLQLHSEFTFDEACLLVDYLDCLGVSTLYCSPFLQAAPGSRHGYDVVDPTSVNVELGGATALKLLSERLKSKAMGLLADIVPNHMAVDAVANRWWRDVLANGQSSRYAGHFDIAWSESEGPSAGSETVLVPVLGDHYGRVIEAGDIVLSRVGATMSLSYHEHQLPVSPRTLDGLLARAAETSGSSDLQDLSAAFGALPDARRTDHTAVMARHDESVTLLDRLELLLRLHPDVAHALDAELDRVNSTPDEMDLLLRRQNYRLARWRTANEQLDYRRFFNIQSLIGVRVEDEQVFSDTHELILGLVSDATVDGLRVDHVDGLRDPEGYLHRLARASGTYTVVEKILGSGEELSPRWPVAGTTGYEFVSRVNHLLVDPAGEEPLGDCYRRLSGQTEKVGEVVSRAKEEVLEAELRPELDRLVRLLADVCDRHRRHRDHTPSELSTALSRVLVNFPVYRTYVQPDRPVDSTDSQSVNSAIEAASARADIDRELLDFIGQLLLLQWPGGPETVFALSFPQVSAPLMAKGVEDTAFYRYNRLISLNEVGGDPAEFGRPLERFHADCVRTAESWPDTMTTLSTHDTKRSADVRARINLLSEMPAAWEEAVSDLFDRSAKYVLDGGPDANARYLFFQTLVGTWPISTDRLTGYMEKATKEAKVYTSWNDPVTDYDRAVRSFVENTVADCEFVSALERFLAGARIVELGRAMALAQVALLLTCPGVPDLYQGSELWDLSLVDPDNRRPVDYATRREILGGLESGPRPLQPDRDGLGATKMWLTRRLLSHRRDHPDWYATSIYDPLRVEEGSREDTVAFSRDNIAVIVPRWMARTADIAPSRVVLPQGRWTDLLTGSTFEGGATDRDRLLRAFPVAVLERSRA